MRFNLPVKAAGSVFAALLLSVSTGFTHPTEAESLAHAIAKTPALELRTASVRYLANLDLLVFEQQVNGQIGSTLPTPVGQLDGAPVLGCVFPTPLKAEDVGCVSGLQRLI
jgi:hypothetical protein